MELPVQVGQVIAGKYEVERIVARGGGGVVVKARHLTLLEPCAIKLMQCGMLDTPSARERFLREARACARLRGDHVVRIFDVGELDDETPYMVLEYLEGVDLGEYLKPGRPLPVPEAVGYVLQICAALAEAHGLGIVHRDLKPANVFLARVAGGTTRVKLIDFGISKLLADPAGVDSSQTLAGTIMGTPFFMAPEQARGAPADTRADLWAVGVLLYFLVTARLPFEADTPAMVLANVLRREPQRPSEHVPAIPAAIEAVILRCLQKVPAHRPASVNEIAEAIAPFAEDGGAARPLDAPRAGESPSTWPSSLPSSRAGLPPQRSRWMVPVTIAVCICAAAAAAALAPRAPEERPPPRDMEGQVLAMPAPRQVEPPAACVPLPTGDAPAQRPAAPSVQASPPTSPPFHSALVPSTPGFDLGSRH